MNEKMFNTRIIHKHDTEANWAKALNFIPKQGELIVYDVDENYNYERIKIGDGTTKINGLPFYAGSWEDLADKPFGTETVYTEIDSEITVSITNGQTPYTRVPAFKMIYDILPDGNTYLVTWDGIDYIVEGKKPFGNEYLYNSYDEDNGVPFCVYGLRSEMPQIYVAEDGEHTISVAKIETSLKQLDEIYIPDTIARVEDIENAKEVYLAKTTQSYGRFSLVEGTFDKMRTAYRNGKVVCLLVAGVMYYASGCSAESMIFSLPPSNTIEGYDNAILMSTFIVDINNAVSYINYSLVTEEYVSNNVPKIATAEVGQTIVVKSVDENGKPTAWETVDMVGGEKWEELVNVTLDDESIPMIDIGEVATNFKKIRFFITLESMTPANIRFVLSNIEATSGGQTYVVFNETVGNESGRYIIFVEFEPFIESGISWRRLCAANEVGVSAAINKSEFIYNSYDTGWLENDRYLYTSAALPSGSTIKITGTRL